MNINLLIIIQNVFVHLQESFYNWSSDILKVSENVRI